MMERESWPHVLLLLCILDIKPVNCLQGLGGGGLNFNISNLISINQPAIITQFF